MNENTPPEVADDQVDDSIVGSMTEQELGAIGLLRRQGQQTQMQIGEIEVHKFRLLANMNDLENQAQRIMNEAGKRLGIPDGKPWTVAPDGSIRMVPNGGQNPG